MEGCFYTAYKIFIPLSSTEVHGVPAEGIDWDYLKREHRECGSQQIDAWCQTIRALRDVGYQVRYDYAGNFWRVIINEQNVRNSEHTHLLWRMWENAGPTDVFMPNKFDTRNYIV